MRKENPLPQFKVASYKCLGIRLSFEDPTTLLPGGGGEERIGRLRSSEKMPPKYAIFSTVLSKIVGFSLKGLTQTLTFCTYLSSRAFCRVILSIAYNLRWICSHILFCTERSLFCTIHLRKRCINWFQYNNWCTCCGSMSTCKYKIKTLSSFSK